MRCPTCGQAVPETPIGQAILKSGRTLRDIGKEAGVVATTVWRWAEGKDIRLSNARAIAKALGVSLDDL
mgnify:CR=1 FL=1